MNLLSLLTDYPFSLQLSAHDHPWAHNHHDLAGNLNNSNDKNTSKNSDPSPSDSFSAMFTINHFELYTQHCLTSLALFQSAVGSENKSSASSSNLAGSEIPGLYSRVGSELNERKKTLCSKLSLSTQPYLYLKSLNSKFPANFMNNNPQEEDNKDSANSPVSFIPLCLLSTLNKYLDSGVEANLAGKTDKKRSDELRCLVRTARILRQNLTKYCYDARYQDAKSQAYISAL